MTKAEKEKRYNCAVTEYLTLIQKHQKRLNESVLCFKLYGDTNDAEHIKEDAEKIVKYANMAKDVLDQIACYETTD